VSGRTGSAVIRKNAPNRKWKPSIASVVAQFLKNLRFLKFGISQKIIMLKYNKQVKKIKSHHRPEKKYLEV
jgi:hypothetical protein